MRIPAALLALLLAVQPAGSALAQSAAARSAQIPVAAPVATPVLPLAVAPAGLPQAQPALLGDAAPLVLPAPAAETRVAASEPLGTATVSHELARSREERAGERERPAQASARAAVVSPLVAPRATKEGGLLEGAGVRLQRRLDEGLLRGAETRVERRLRDAALLLGGRAAEEVPAGSAAPVRRSGLARFYDQLTHPRAGRALRPAGEGAPPGEQERKEAERAKALVKVVAIGLAFAAVEAVGAWFTGSVALRADAMHLALDTSVSAAALLALWLSRRARGSGDPRRFAKAEPVIGLVSSAAIGFTAVEIGLEVYDRFLAPIAVPGPVTMLLALSGLAANVINAFILRRFRDDGLSMKGAFLHALTDAIGSIGIIASGLAVYFFHWAWADAAIGGVIVALILGTAFNLARSSWKALRAPAPPKGA